MALVRSPNCDCPNAAIGFVDQEGGEAFFAEVYDLTPSGEPTTNDVNLAISFDAFTRKDRFILQYMTPSTGPFNLVDSDCISGGFDGFEVTVPAGATILIAQVIPSCDPSETEPPTEWLFVLQWEEERCP